MKSFFLALIMLVAGCACFQPKHRNDPGCAVLHGVIDCSEAAVVAEIPQFKPIVQALIAKATGADGKIDWTQVGKDFASLGIKDGGCILADIQNDYLASTTASQSEVTNYSEWFVDYRVNHWPGVKFKFVINGKTVLR